ncbi:DinB family protein [Phytoactinopolyspora limicola]|uniref:DinB family protein n=1 Tax=Phytoactinopolyspora limicola TaxID=2715536 RepID=UPI00140E70AE|nr:DinB family protein [Phytoactinopolyspora limicola]
MTNTWRPELLEQLEFYWNVHLRPRLDGLTDDEYLWEPVPGSWSLRTGDNGRPQLERQSPEPPVPPLTTIAWRAVHIGYEVFGTRARAFFGPTSAPDDADMYDGRHWPEPLPATADEALAFLDEAYSLWHGGIAALSDADLRKPLGPKGADFADYSMAQLVLHVNREVMAHGAEICLLRDLYRAFRDHEDPLIGVCLVGDAAAAAGAEPTRVDQVRRTRPELVAQVAGLHHWSTVRFLVERGFDVNAGSPSALHFAAAAGRLEEVRFLIDHGADPEAVDSRYGLPPAGWADYFKRGDVADYLRSGL